MKLLHNNNNGHMPPLCDCVTVSRVTNGRDTIWLHHHTLLCCSQSRAMSLGAGRGGFCEAQGKGQVYQIFVIKLNQIAQNLKKLQIADYTEQKPVRSLLCLLETRTVDRNCELTNSSSMFKHDTRNCMLFIY